MYIQGKRTCEKQEKQSTGWGGKEYTKPNIQQNRMEHELK
jgi:hypothetical protein